MELEPRREAVLAAEEERSDDPGSPKEDGSQDAIRKGDERQLGIGTRGRVVPAAQTRQLERCTYEPPIEHSRVLMEAGGVSFGYLCTTLIYTHPPQPTNHKCTHT